MNTKQIGSTIRHYDTLIVGFGKAGKTLAAALAARQEHVALVEQSSAMYGGTCINVGCIPSKTLVVRAGKLPYTQAVEQKTALVTKLRAKNFAKLDNLSNVDVINGHGSFIAERTLEVNTGQDVITLTGDRVIINTGSTPVMPPILGLDQSQHVYTSATLMDRQDLPQTLAIIGGGYIGLEFASMYARYGSHVVVLAQDERILPREDEDVVEAITSVLEEQGVQFELGAHVDTIADDKDGVNISYQTSQGNKEQLTANAVLVATGRRANTCSLNLDAAGVATNERGTIVVDERLHTSAPHTWAVGDVKGGPQFTYVSLDDYRIIMNQLFGDGTRTTQNRGNLAYSMFITPTFSRVGMSEAEAQAAGHKVRIFKLSVAAVPKAHVLGQPAGIMKAVVDADTNEILGCVLLCANSEEVINTVALAMDNHLPYQALRDHVFTHPTMAEALNDLFSQG